MPIIEADGLTKTYRVFQKKEGLLGALRGLYKREYKEVKAVGDVGFSIEPGEMVAFLGPNGAGKTTTLKMLSGLIYPTAGSARVLGFVPWKRDDLFRRQFALVMGQKNQLWWDLPAADSFQLHREIYSLPQADFKQTLGELTELLGVEKLTRQAVRELSPGRADEDGADRRPAPPAPAAAPGRADDRPRRGGAGGDPEVPEGLSRPPGRDDAPDQPLHAGRRGPLRPGPGDHPGDARLRRAALGDRRPVRPGQARPAPVRRGDPRRHRAVRRGRPGARGRRPTSRSTGPGWPRSSRRSSTATPSTT